ncbi:hypothetical protein OIU77_016429 [Salix suchowensis]|uniref:Uncharacterized protein n=1 Tax=Salix suchowensis TaxID=1278906 RepID=A0ABQ8ZKC8_9ROSI|nr:hypothetical protein OIU77_016429 [Salix suchowensis]
MVRTLNLQSIEFPCPYCNVLEVLEEGIVWVDFFLEDREKKPRKEKKDKEREDKEKREKDRSDRKHRGKKDKKEKLREKKEKDRKKSSVSDEKRLPGQAKLGNGGDKASGEGKLPGQSKQINGDKALDGRKLPEKSEGNRGEIGAQKGKERDEEKNRISGEKFAGKFSGYNGQKLIQINSNLSHHTRDSKFVQELGRRARDEDRNQFLEKFPGTVAKGDEGMVRLVAIDPGNWVDGKEKNKRDDDRKMDGQGIRERGKIYWHCSEPFCNISN